MGIGVRGLKGYFTVGNFVVSINQSEAGETKLDLETLKERRQQLQGLMDELDKEIKDTEGQ